MRAVAVGMATSEGLPLCPRDCGGRLGGEFPDLLTESQRQLRMRNGCDADAAHFIYTITCPRCDGSKVLSSGKLCDYCEGRGPIRGERKMRRCPSSHMTTEISDCLRHYPHAEGGIFPLPGGLMSQSPTYIQFLGVLNGEVSKVQRESMKERSK